MWHENYTSERKGNSKQLALHPHTATGAREDRYLWPGSAEKSSEVITGKVGKVIWLPQIMGSAEEFNVTMTTPV